MKDEIKDIILIIGFILLALIFFICGMVPLYKGMISTGIILGVISFLFFGCALLVWKFGKRGNKNDSNI